MASENGHHEALKLNQHEVDALADRLLNRAISVLAVDTLRSMQSDTLLAVACLRDLSHRMPDDGIKVQLFKPNTREEGV
jgi:hypothetical protein